MELLLLLGIPYVGFVLFIAPVFSWRANRRVRRLTHEVALLGTEVSRLQMQVHRLQSELQLSTVRSESGVAMEAPAERVIAQPPEEASTLVDLPQAQPTVSLVSRPEAVNEKVGCYESNERQQDVASPKPAFELPFAMSESSLPVNEAVISAPNRELQEALGEVPSTPPEFARPGFNLEEVLGAQLFLRAGVAIVLLGVVFFLAYALGQMGPFGRVLTGAAAGGVMLAGGLVAERRERYVTFGRALIAGGFATLYFVAFACHFIAAARVIDSPVMAVGLLLAVGAASVGFSLRYRHERTTVFSFLLIFLSLLLAAVEPIALLNLVVTTLASAGLAFLAWRLRWSLLLGLGTLASWGIAYVWVVTAVERDGSLAVVPSFVQLGILWLVLQMVMTWPPPSAQASELSSADPLPRESNSATLWIAALSGLSNQALVANNVAALGLGLFCAKALNEDYLFAVPAVLGVCLLVVAAAFARQKRRSQYLLSATLAIGALALVSPLRLGFDHDGLAVYRLIGIEVLFAAGIYLRERYFRSLAYLAAIPTLVQLLSLRANALIVVDVPISHEFDLRLLAFGCAAAFGAGNALLLATRWRDIVNDWEEPAVSYALTAIAAFFLMLLCLEDVPSPWAPAAMAGVAFVGLLLGRRTRRVDLVAEASAMTAIAMATLANGAAATGLAQGDADLQPPALSAIATTTLLLFTHALVRRDVRSVEQLNKLLSGLGIIVSRAPGVFAAFGLGMLVFRHVSTAWVGPVVCVIALVYLGAAARSGWSELWGIGFAYSVLSAVAVGAYSWNALGDVSGLRGRLPAVAVSICVLYATCELVHRSRAQLLAFLGSVQRLRLELGFRSDGVSRESARAATMVLTASWWYLALPSVLLLALIKVEAMAQGRNYAVTVAWSVVALIYLELGRRRCDGVWLAFGHLGLAAATVHFFLANLPLSGTVAFVPLSVATAMPLLGALTYVYWSLAEHLPMGVAQSSREVRRYRSAYLYAVVCLLATLALYELHRSWVVVAWAALSFGLILLWTRNRDDVWRLAAAAMALATVARGASSNLYLRDLNLNLVVLPVTCALLLGGYLVVRRDERGNPPVSGVEAARSEAAGAVARMLSWGRLAWLLACVALLTSFVWIEAEGTLLTVSLSLEGFCLIALGFAVRERIARLLGLALLSFCVTKLFFYDMRGLGGLPRIASFVVLGLVLIAVSFGYLRFRERMKDLL